MIRSVVTLVLVLGLTSCGGDEPGAGGGSATPAKPADTGAGSSVATPKAPAAPVVTGPVNTSGEITGRITHTGTPAAGEPVDLSSDAYCADHHGDAGLRISAVEVDGSGGLANAFVQLTAGVPDAKWPEPGEPVLLDQVGCTYVPHVFGVRTKQTVKIHNGDDTLHNIHPTPALNKEFNIAMPNKGDVREKNFRKPEDAIPFRCDVHTWMRAFCFVMDHPFFAVSNADGSFSIDIAGLPDGEYGIKVWHELLGEATGTVTLKGGRATFDADLSMS